MAEHPNVTLMKQVYDAFTSGDVQRAASYWTHDCVHHYPGRSFLAGEHKGIEEALGFAGKLFELTEGKMEMEVLDIGASDTHAYSLLRTKYVYKGRSLEMPFINIVRFKDGKIAEFWTYPDDQYAVDELWAA